MMKLFRSSLFVFGAITCLCVNAQVATTIQVPATAQVTKAIIFVPLGKAKTTQALLSIKNTGLEPLTLIKATSPLAKKVLLFPSVESSKQMSGSSNPWALAPNQLLDMKSDKLCLVFDGIKYQISTGDDVEVTLWFSDGKKKVVMAKAKSAYDQKHSE